ncbi:uncharacterized protein [Drosophila takahashii]|uniref:uncharacterized protein n=1 Tax=Drosophila takahashii TaxID=29030 RepID=UPI001CF861F2|nr:uncharacterized protein LOC108056516 [Drosophila takahashii]
MKILYSVVALLLSLTNQTFGLSEQPLAVLKASGDDPKTPLIVLTNPIAKPTFGESIESEHEIETTLMPDTTATSKKLTKKTQPPQKKKSTFSHGQKQKLPLQDLLLMPGMWESSPISAHGPMDTMATQPVFYPLPVYIPYPIPFMLNPQMLPMRGPSKDKVEDQIAVGFNEMMSENLLRSSFQQDNESEWQSPIKNRLRPANQNGYKKWWGKWRKTTTNTTTSTTKASVTNPTEPTRLLLSSSSHSGSEVKSIETIVDNETTEAAS